MAPEPWQGVGWGDDGVRELFRLELSTSLICFSAHCLLMISALIAIHCKKKVLWWKLRAVLICGCEEKNLGCPVMLCPFSRKVVSRSLIIAWPMDFLNQKVAVYPHNFHVMITPGIIFCQASCHCSSQGSQLGKAADYFSLGNLLHGYFQSQRERLL